MNVLNALQSGGPHLELAATVTLQITAVVLLAAVVASVLLRGRPAAQHAVCLAALACTLSGPLLVLLFQRTGVATASIRAAVVEIPEREFRADEALSERSTTGPAGLEPESDPARSGARGATGDSENATVSEVADVAPLPEAATSGVRAEEPVAAQADRLQRWSVVLLALWSAGLLFFQARFVHGWRAVVRLRRTLVPLDAERYAPLLARVGRSLGVERLPAVAVSSSVGLPAAMGVVRPVVVVPDRLLAGLSDDQLCDLLVHECAHIVRRDHWVGLLQRIAESLFWPHPLVHCLNRQLSRAREALCDNYVLRQGSATRYAGTLLELTESAGSLPRSAGALALIGPRWKLADRVAWLLDERGSRDVRAGRLRALLIGGTFLALAVGLAGVRFVRANAEEPSREEPPAQADDGPTPEQSEPLERRISRLIGELGHKEFTVRQAAEGQLLEIGPPALDAVRAALRDPSVEIKIRSRFIVRTIEDDLQQPALVIVNGDGTNPRRIRIGGQRHFGSPAWSPTGKQIAFDAWSGAANNYLTARVYVSNLDGSEARDLGDGAMPSWSPDGERLAFHRYGANRGVWIMNADGNAARRIQPSGISPRWSPDGRRIAFVAGGISIYDTTDGGLRRFLPRGFEQVDIGISWSPDGQRIAFTGTRKAGGKALAVTSAAADPDADVVILHEGRAGLYTSWSPDGRQIVFNMTTEDIPRMQVYTISSDGRGGLQRLKGQGRGRLNFGTGWSPDGTKIIYASRPLAESSAP